jgi:predicted phage terminase large subunit-like protein
VQWEVVYKKAYNNDGSLFFPEKLTHAFLERQKREQGSYIFSNQYLNEIIPLDMQSFKKEWFQYYESIPKIHHNFCFIDPAISQADTADFTGVVVVAVDCENRWYVRFAKRYKITPTQLISLVFELQKNFQCQAIGIEEVAFQKALVYFLADEMKRRNIFLPIKGIKPNTDKTKEMRILSLVPRFEWNRIFLNKGLNDLELELLMFPRGAHDDLADSLCAIDTIAFPPSPEKLWDKPPAPNHPDYEKYYRYKMMSKDRDET